MQHNRKREDRGLFQRGDVYWCDFYDATGTRYRQSLDTKKLAEARKELKARIAKASAGKLSAHTESFARLTFSEAADKHLGLWSVEVSRKTRQVPAPSTITKETQLLVPLKAFFGGTRLNQITAEHVQAYSTERAKTCGPGTIAMELGTLRRILKRAKLWNKLADEVSIPRPPETIGHSISPAQKAKLLQTAQLKPEWQTAFYAMTLALNTTMRGCELRGLRWADIDLLDSTLAIRKSKTDAGVRVLPLTPDAFEALVKLRERAELFGPVEPEHFVFASFRPVGRFDNKKLVETRITQFDPDRPIKGWRTAWRKLTTKAGLPGYRFHNCRHQAITELCESGAAESTVKAIAGHVSHRMLDRYSHIRLEAKRQALEAFTRSPAGQSQKGHGTHLVTNDGPEAPAVS